eukprot:763427-Hanusia_phi.AAC.2
MRRVGREGEVSGGEFGGRKGSGGEFGGRKGSGGEREGGMQGSLKAVLGSALEGNKPVLDPLHHNILQHNQTESKTRQEDSQQRQDIDTGTAVWSPPDQRSHAGHI